VGLSAGIHPTISAQERFPWDFLPEFFPLFRRKCVFRGTFCWNSSYYFGANAFSVGVSAGIHPTNSAQVRFPWVFLLAFLLLIRRKSHFRGRLRLISFRDLFYSPVGLQWFIWSTVVYFGLQWFILVYSGLFWSTLAYFGLLWFVLVCFGLP
jgi:hypothetical protein